MSPLIVVGVDGGISHLGMAAMRVEDRVVIDATVAGTKPSNKKLGLNQGEDTVRRVLEVKEAFCTFLAKHQPIVVGMERLSPVRNAGVMCKLGMSWGALLAAADDRRIPVLHFPPVDVKRSLGLPGTASKEDVIGAVQQRWPKFRAWPKTRSLWEHMADACAVALSATKDRSVVVAMNARAGSQQG